MKSANLMISLLGPVEISYQGKTIKLNRRVERGILYYLVVENRPIRREKLIDLLWPAADQIDPRALIRVALSRLRSQLPDVVMLTTEQNYVSLNCSNCLIDLVKFEESYQSLGGVLSAFPEERALPIQIVNQIKESLDLWRGDEVFQGEDFSNYPSLQLWHQTLEKDLQSHLMYLKRKLAEHYRASGNLELALDEFLQLIRLNKLDKTLHLIVLDIFLKLGRLQDALEFCDDLEVIYEQEYNAPLPDDILKYCHEVQQLIYAHEEITKNEWPISSLLQVPLIGRTKEVEQLTQLFYRGGTAFIKGRLGVGKTRLVQGLFESLTPKPLLILASAKEGETTLPFASIVHGLRQHLPSHLFQEVGSVWANQLSLILPELINLRDDIGEKEVEKPPFSRQRLFDSLYQLFVLASEKYGRILIFLDDAQWADYQTLQALSYLVSRGFFERKGLLIIAADIEYPQHDLQKIINQLRQTSTVETITLPAFNPEEMRSLVQSALNQPPTTEFLMRLYKETNGNPLMAISMLRHMLDVSPSVEDLMQMEHMPLPDNIYDILSGRLNRLSPDARQLITVAALIGNDISLNLLQSVTGLSEQPFLTALDLLIQSGFIFDHPVSHANESYVHFAHRKIREIVNYKTSLTTSQVLHHKIADLLSQSDYSSAQAGIIAEHYLAAGDEQKTVKWLLVAADHVWNLGFREEVLEIFRKAEKILYEPSQAEFGSGDFLLLYDQMSKFAFQSNQIHLLEEIGIKLQELGAKFPNDELMGLAYLSLAYACFYRDDLENGLLLSEKTIKRLDKKIHPELLIRTLYYRASFQWWTLGFDEVEASKNQMVKILEEISESNPKKKSLGFLTQLLSAHTHYAKGETKEALRVAEATYSDYFEGLSTHDRLLIYYALSRSHFLAGNMEQCAHFAQEAYKISQAIDNRYLEIFTLNNLGKYEIICGHLDDAFEHANRVLELAEIENKPQDIAAASTLLGDIHALLNNYPQAVQHFRYAQIRQGFSFNYFHAIENNIHLARWLTRSGHFAEARLITQECLRITNKKGMISLYSQSLLADGLIDLEENNASLAEQKFQKAIALVEKNELTLGILWGKLRMAQLAFAQEKYEFSEKLLSEVIKTALNKKIITVSKSAFELAAKLYKRIPLKMDGNDLKAAHQAMLRRLETHTQTEVLRKLFINAQRLWHEECELY